MTAQIVPNDPNMDYYMNDRVERRIWGPSSYVPGVGNRRMVAAATTIPGSVENGIDSITVVTHDRGNGTVRYLI